MQQIPRAPFPAAQLNTVPNRAHFSLGVLYVSARGSSRVALLHGSAVSQHYDETFMSVTRPGVWPFHAAKLASHHPLGTLPELNFAQRFRGRVDFLKFMEKTECRFFEESCFNLQ